MRLEEAVVYSFLLVGQLDSAPGETAAQDTHNGGQREVWHKERGRDEADAGSHDPLPAIGPKKVFQLDDPHESCADGESGKYAEENAGPVQTLLPPHE